MLFTDELRFCLNGVIVGFAFIAEGMSVTLSLYSERINGGGGSVTGLGGVSQHLQTELVVIAGNLHAAQECQGSAMASEELGSNPSSTSDLWIGGPLIKLSITWRKNRVLVTSGLSDFNRRLTIIGPVVSDSGFYECEVVLRSSSVPSVNAGAYLHVQEPPQFVKEPEKHITAEMEKIVDIPCQARGLFLHDPQHGQCHKPLAVLCEISCKTGMSFLAMASEELVSHPLTRLGPAGSRGQLPYAPENPAALLSSSEKRAINLTWAKPFDGNSPLLHYILEVSENNAPWAILLANIEPESTAVTVSGLIPARSYQFRLCAVNDVGKGQFSKETDRVSLPEEPPSAPPQNVIASGRTNQSIMIQWQPPPESHQNGVLRGYSVRYRLTGLPVDYQSKNISKPDVTNILLEDLIIWTNYEIEVAAYNRAGLGTFSHKVTEWTLQGVPTIAPSKVQVEAVNSTTIRITWAAPNPQFINGINQGYKKSS
ncbi:protein sidekick-2-like [Salvelinus sp. IW2-2015]|uniref:protein sidekick-2-like n=1 Tax=Salvelinus sp. IW2-2015 TaxID=2691554 RepID=UPI0038D37E0A